MRVIVDVLRDADDRDNDSFLAIVAGQNLRLHREAVPLSFSIYVEDLKELLRIPVETCRGVEEFIRIYLRGGGRFVSGGSSDAYFLNSVILQEEGLYAAFNEQQKTWLLDAGFEEVSISSVVEGKGEFSNSGIVVLNLSGLSGQLIDFAFYSKYQIFDARKSFNVPSARLDKNFKVYGWPGFYRIAGKFDLPKENFFVSNISKAGGFVVPSDLCRNLALYYNLNDLIPTPVAPTSTNFSSHTPAEDKHLIAFVFTDGDNVGMMDNKIPRYIREKNSRYPNLHISWTISTTAPKIYLRKIFGYANETDTFVSGPSSSYGYVFANLVPKNSRSLVDDEILRRYGIRHTNIITSNPVKGIWSLIQDYLCGGRPNRFEAHDLKRYLNGRHSICSSPGVKSALIWDYFSYSAGNGGAFIDDSTDTLFTSATKTLYFKSFDIENFLERSSFKRGEAWVVPVNLNDFTVEKLVNQVVSKLPKDLCEVASLDQVVERIRAKTNRKRSSRT